MHACRRTVIVTTAVALAAAASAGAATPQVFRYADGPDHIPHLIASPADADRYLPHAPASFKRFAVRESRHVAAGADPSCTYPSGLRVEAYSTEGYAEGAVSECGSAFAAVWSDYGHGRRHGGRWRQIAGTQNDWPCGSLHRFKVPSALVGTTCAVYGNVPNAGEHHYQQR